MLLKSLQVHHWLLQLLLPLTIAAVLVLAFCCYFLLLFVLFFQFLILIFHFPTFFVIMTSHCFNFRFAYPLPLLPYLHTTRMASGHPTDKFSFMYQPDTHKRYETRKHAPSRSHAAPPPSIPPPLPVFSKSR